MKCLLRVIHIQVHSVGFFVCVVTVVKSSFSSVITSIMISFQPPPPFISKTMSETMFLMSFHRCSSQTSISRIQYLGYWYPVHLTPFVRNNATFIDDNTNCIFLCTSRLSETVLLFFSLFSGLYDFSNLLFPFIFTQMPK